MGQGSGEPSRPLDAYWLLLVPIALKTLLCALPCMQKEFEFPASNVTLANRAPMDLRKEIRYRLEAPAIFTWENFQNKRLQGEGITRDISLLGAFILAPTCPPNGTIIRAEVALPSLTGIRTDIRILGRARVVRVEHPSGGQGDNGFAVVREDLSHWSLSTGVSEFDWNREVVSATETNWE